MFFIDIYNKIIERIISFLLNKIEKKDEIYDGSSKQSPYIKSRREKLVDILTNLVTQDYLELKNLPNRDEAVIIGLFGKWGTGKTRIFEQINEKLKKANHLTPYSDICTVFVNAWQYGDDQLSFLRILLLNILDSLREQNAISLSFANKKKNEILYDSTSIDMPWKYILIPLIAIISIIILLYRYPGIYKNSGDIIIRNDYPGIIYTLNQNNSSTENTITLDNGGTLDFNFNAAFPQLNPEFQIIIELLGIIVPSLILFVTISRVRPKSKVLFDFEYHLKDIIQKLKKQKVLIFLDDIDRLEPLKAKKILDRIKAFTKFNKLIFLISLDKDILYEAINKALKSKDKSYIELELYLDKVFDFRYSLPPMEEKEVKVFLDTFIKNNPEFKEYGFADEKLVPKYSNYLFKYFSGNFRQVERFLFELKAILLLENRQNFRNLFSNHPVEVLKYLILRKFIENIKNDQQMKNRIVNDERLLQEDKNEAQVNEHISSIVSGKYVGLVIQLLKEPDKLYTLLKEQEYKNFAQIIEDQVSESMQSENYLTEGLNYYYNVDTENFDGFVTNLSKIEIDHLFHLIINNLRNSKSVRSIDGLFNSLGTYENDLVNSFFEKYQSLKIPVQNLINDENNKMLGILVVKLLNLLRNVDKSLQIYFIKSLSLLTPDIIEVLTIIYQDISPDILGLLTGNILILSPDLAFRKLSLVIKNLTNNKQFLSIIEKDITKIFDFPLNNHKDILEIIAHLKSKAQNSYRDFVFNKILYQKNSNELLTEVNEWWSNIVNLGIAKGLWTWKEIENITYEPLMNGELKSAEDIFTFIRNYLLDSSFGTKIQQGLDINIFWENILHYLPKPEIIKLIAFIHDNPKYIIDSKPTKNSIISDLLVTTYGTDFNEINHDLRFILINIFANRGMNFWSSIKADDKKAILDTIVPLDDEEKKFIELLKSQIIDFIL